MAFWHANSKNTPKLAKNGRRTPRQNAIANSSSALDKIYSRKNIFQY